MRQVGPSIEKELEAAGVLGLPFVWNPETKELNLRHPSLTGGQKQVIRAVFQAHNPATPVDEDRNTGRKVDMDFDLQVLLSLMGVTKAQYIAKVKELRAGR